VKLMISALI